MAQKGVDVRKHHLPFGCCGPFVRVSCATRLAPIEARRAARTPARQPRVFSNPPTSGLHYRHEQASQNRTGGIADGTEQTDCVLNVGGPTSERLVG
jgi:hypothetical protein